MLLIKDLKKNDKFIFNDTLFYVTKKYRNENSPLKATNQEDYETELFYFDELEVTAAN